MDKYFKMIESPLLDKMMLLSFSAIDDGEVQRNNTLSILSIIDIGFPADLSGLKGNSSCG